MTTTELYDNTIRLLPASERLRLARLILEGLPPESVVDYDDAWSAQDIEEFTRGGLERMDEVADDA